MVERLPPDDLHTPELAGRTPEAEPLPEFTVVVEETYLVPYRVRARSKDHAARRVLDNVEGEEEWAHVEWVEGSDHLLYSVSRNPLPTKSPVSPAANTAPTDGTADPDRS